jgi:hypothetical protein
MNLPTASSADPLGALPLLGRQGLGRRVRDMALVWAFFGALVGVGVLPPEHGAIGIISGILAGLIVLTPLGVILALLGGQAPLALLGGVCGAGLSGLLSLFAPRAGTLYPASVGLIGGALAGATLSLVASRALFLVRRLAPPIRGKS